MLSNRSLLEHRARQLGREAPASASVPPNLNLAALAGVPRKGVLIRATTKGGVHGFPIIGAAATTVILVGLSAVAAAVLASSAQRLFDGLLGKIKRFFGKDEPESPPLPVSVRPMPRPRPESIPPTPDAVTVATQATLLVGEEEAKPLPSQPAPPPPESEGIPRPKAEVHRQPAPPMQRTAVETAADKVMAPMSRRDATVGAIIRKAAETVGISPDIMLTFAKIESGFDPSARAKSSSARGLFQLVADTWKELVAKYGAKVGVKESDINDPWANAIMAAIWLKQNMDMLRSRAGIANPTATDLYVTHFLGRNGALRFFGNLGGIGAELFPAAAKANPSIFFDKHGRPRTVAEVYELLATKVGQAKASVGKMQPVMDAEYQRLSNTGWIASPLASAGKSPRGGALLAAGGRGSTRRSVSIESGVITADQADYFG